MPNTPPTLPGWKAICSIVAVSYILLGSSMLARGAHASMQPFGLPEPILSSPHFADFFHFLFVHMVVLGLLIGMLGRYVDSARHQVSIARVLLLVQLHYTYLDLRTSDSALGNALYRGPRSLAPAVIDVIVVLSFAYLSFWAARRLPPTPQA